MSASPREKVEKARRRPARAGFTLAELLVTITIIAILAGLVWAGVARARESARIAKTKSTIAKINQIIMERYDSYRTRRVPINTRGLPPPAAAEFRLWAIRCLMAWEMPDRLSDVAYPPNENDPLTYSITVNGQPVTREIYRTPLARAYFRQFQLRGQPSGDQSPAEMLYLVVTLGTPGSREMFSDSEIGDTDGDGYLEFIDGWGRPIYFIRCAPGFTESDIQLHPLAPIEEKNRDHDPFDPMRVDPGAWRLVPLIYSAGPDGVFGLDLQGNLRYFVNWKQWYMHPVGAPVDSSNPEFMRHEDNIHNHAVESLE
ncbi:MAG: hypothetical protein Kow0040_17040 [Thermogutta sp.]